MRTVVIGGGISGLACAFRLRQFGLAVTLLEQTGRVGGVIETAEKDGFLFELGPQSFLGTEPLLDLIRELGLDNELLQADPRAPRYVLVGGRLQEVPLAPPALLTTSLLSAGTKLRLLAEPLRCSRPPEEDESVADFVQRKFGAELLDRLVSPFVSGVYAGDPKRLSLRSAFPEAYRWEKEYGSLIRGAMKSRPEKGKPRPGLCSFRQGNAALVRSLGEKLGESLHCESGVESVRWSQADGKSRFELPVNFRDRAESIVAGAVVVATPTKTAGRILAGISPRFPELLGRIEYAPVAVVGLGYRREQVKHPLAGFGFLVPRSEGLRSLGAVWTSSLFAGRAPEGMVSLTTFAGGATDAALFEMSDEQIAARVEQELALVLGISGAPAIRIVWRHTRALPQYNLGHGALLAEIREELASLPGLFLAGNYLEGPALGACVEHANRTAEAVQSYLASLVY